MILIHNTACILVYILSPPVANEQCGYPKVPAVSSVSVHFEMGTVAPHLCGYTIRSEHKPHGYIMSPTYPGVYSDNLYCHYKLQGKPEQRIKLVFQDFSLFYGGE